MTALVRTLVGMLLGAIIARLSVLLSKLHERTPERLVSRRRFLRNTVLGAVGVVVLETVGAFVYFFWPNKTGAFGKEIAVPQTLLPAVGAEPYVNQAGKFYIINNEDGALALYWKCPHLGCTVPWADTENLFICPCHGSVYDRHGVRVAGPAPRPMDLMEMRQEANGTVIVDTGNIILRTEWTPEQSIQLNV